MSYPSGDEQPTSHWSRHEIKKPEMAKPDYMQMPPPTSNEFQNFSPINQSSNISSQNGSRLTTDQLRWLMNHLTIDDQRELKESLGGCSSSVFLGRALPIGMFCAGAAWYSQRMLPEAYRLKSPYLVYSMFGLGAAMTSFMFFNSKCFEQAQPKLKDLYVKYSSQQQNTYDQLRQKHRAGIPVSQDYSMRNRYDNRAIQYNQATPPDSYQATPPDYGMYQPQLEGQTAQPQAMPEKRDLSSFYHGPTFISGTPISLDPTRSSEDQYTAPKDEFSFK